MKALCIVSNREQNLRDFFCEWQEAGDWDCVVLVEDGPTIEMRELDCPWPLHHFARCDVERQLGDDAWIVSQGDTSRVSYAFLQAAQLGAEWLLKLDDDCLPVGRRQASGVRRQDREEAAGICAAHLAALERSRCESTCDIRVRGLPYRNVGRLQSRLNCGLWRGVPDLGAPEGLHPTPAYSPPLGTRLAHPVVRYPMCGMNLFFHRDLLPALYFGLQGRGHPYRRFDDIWAGWIFQKLAQHCGIPWSFGEPHIHHSRASDPFKNLVAEAPGIALNETLWQRIDSIELSAATATHLALADAARELGANLAGDADAYIARLGLALCRWVERSRPNRDPDA